LVHTLEEEPEPLEKTPRRRVRSKIPGPRRPRPSGFFKRMSDSRLVAYAQWIVDDTGIKNRSQLYKEDSSVYQNLRERKLLDRIKFQNK